MQIKLTKPWSGYPVGHKFTTMHEGMCRTLVNRGFAKAIKGGTKAKPKPQQPTPPPPPQEAAPTNDNDNDTASADQSDGSPDDSTGKRSGRKKAV